jgi:Flp pilus assembly protein TadG
MKRKAEPYVRGFVRKQRGAVAIAVALSTFMLFGFFAISVDAGHLIHVQSSLQASANMAAMAGARNFKSGTATAAALSYSAQAGSRNAIPGQDVTVTVTLQCLSTVETLANGAIPCAVYGSQPSANAIQVTQTASAPTFFAGVFGIRSVTVRAVATAVPQGSGSGSGSSPIPLNVALVLDTTQSMNTDDTSCHVVGKPVATRLDCALNGIRVLLGQLLPAVDQVHLLVFPGLTNTSQIPKEYDCLSTTPSIAEYDANPVYKIITSSIDYRTGSPPADSLNTNSNLSKAVGGGTSSCQPLSAVGGVGTYYADVITAAQSALVASHQAGQQNVIVFLGDGDASASSSKVPPGKASNQCRQAVTAAQAATAAGTWVYSIAYGASTSSSGSCSTDSPHISACAAMQQIASDTAKFYSDHPTSCISENTESALSAIFNSIAGSLSSARLIPNGTM